MELGLSPDAQARFEQIAKLPRRARVALVVGIVALLCGGYYYGFYQANDAELKRLQAQEQELQRKLSEVRSIAANIAAFEAEIAGLERKLKVALRQLPNKKELEVLLTDMSNLGKTAGVEISSFKRNDEVIHDFYAEVPIDLELSGEYHDVAKFFELMSKLPRIVNMGALTMKVRKESLDSTVLNVSGTATTFRFVENEAGA